MSEHTPGPWHLEDPNGGSNEDFAVHVYSGTRLVASLANYRPKERIANGRLIAAAPGLLAALTDLLDHLRPAPGFIPLPGERTSPFVESAERARALIARLSK